MYVPSSFREDDPARLEAAVREHAFALLVCAGAGDAPPEAVHAPLLWEAGDPPRLRGHVARANPIWRRFDGTAPALAVFAGPHAYVSPRWYPGGPSVPTWNYVAVHVTGRPRVIEDAQQARELLDRLSAVYEGEAPDAWRMDAQPPEFVERMLRGIVAFEMPVEGIQGAWKLSQNRDAATRRGVVAGLRADGRPEGLAVARAMEAP